MGSSRGVDPGDVPDVPRRACILSLLLVAVAHARLGPDPDQEGSVALVSAWWSSRFELDPVTHAPVRLRLMGIAKTLPEVEYAALRDRLEISDSVLSKHLAALREVGYVSLRKGKLAGRSRTWVSVS